MAAGDRARSETASDVLAVVGRHPGVTIVVGAIGVLIGVLVLVWPAQTAVVIAWLFAIQMLVTGGLRLVTAFAGDRSTTERVLLVLLGALAVLVGLLCLRAPLQTVVVLGLLIGAAWVVGGVVDVVIAIGAAPGGGRGWRIASGLLSVVGGAVVLVYPGASLVALSWLIGIVLVVTSGLLVVEGMTGRRASRARGAVATTS